MPLAETAAAPLRVPVSPAMRQSLRRLVVLASVFTVLATSAVSLHLVGTARAAGVVHVSTTGSDGANGSAGSPVRTITRAVQIASPGDTVQIADGTYHEQVQVYAKELHITAAPGAAVVLDGAVAVEGWMASGGDWYVAWQTDFARAGQPHTVAEIPEAGWPEQFFFDGTELAEVTSRAAVVPGTFFNDTVTDRVWIGNDPAGHLVEGSDLAWGIYLNRANGSSVSNVTIRRYATPSSNMAAVRAYANNLTLSGVTVENNSYMGVSSIGTNIAIDGLTARNNGHLGAHGHQSTNLSITNATIIGNNADRFDAHHAAGGIKITNSNGVTISDSDVHDNAGPGIWTDLSTTNVVVANNHVTGNARSGIEIELSDHVIVVGNAISDNAEAGVWVLESHEVSVWHNAAFQNVRDIWIEDGPRSDVNNVDVVNNTLGGGAVGAPAILNVDDWTGQRSTEQMNVTLAGNRYWLPSGSSTPNISRLANWPYPLLLSPSLQQHRSASGHDLDATFSAAPTNPYVRDAAAGDYRQPEGAPAVHVMPPAVASAAGAATGVAMPAGPLQAFTRGTPPNPPTTNPPTTNPPTTNPPTTNPPATNPPTVPSSQPSSLIQPAVRMSVPQRRNSLSIGSASLVAAITVVPGQQRSTPDLHLKNS